LFVTTSAMRHEVASRLMPGVDVWDAVEVEFQVPILLLSVSPASSSQDGLVRRTFLGKPHHLAQFRTSSELQLSSVALFSPSHLNGTGAWQLDRLSEVWECLDPSDGSRAWLFVLADGRRLTDSLQHTVAENLVREMCRYSESGELESSCAGAPS
jgi:hypothetical protein